MKSIFVTSAFIVLSFFNLHAQDFQGMAVYESKTSTADFKSRMQGNKDITPEMQKMIEERTKQMFEKTFILNFDKSTSIYKEEEKLDAPGQQGGGMRMMMAFLGGGPIYKNVKTKSYAIANEFMGKEFLVKDSLPEINWKMEGESRMIGGYNCFKATAVIPVSKSDFRNMRPKKEEPKKDEAKAPDADKKTNFMDDVEMPKEITVTAWYAPEIPVNQGPEKYWGLPGLILEINDGKTIVLCSKLVLNPKDKVVIKEPTNGEVVSQKKYDEIVIKKTEEMREQFQNRGRDGSGNRTIRIGG
ncbi:MAG TPA: GLPGLI family protein [Flavobacterium sp.]|nr:GLPGLI family protein [Flavobacterium sp.]